MRWFIVILVFSCSFAKGQTYRYLVRFTDKASSPYAISNPSAFLSQRAIERRGKQGIQVTENDFPPNANYLDSLKSKGALVIYPTRWLNGALIQATEAQKDSILQLSFVNAVEFNTPLKQVRKATRESKFSIEETSSLNYGDASAQINLLGVDSMHNAGFYGENMLVAVMDNGFLNANTIDCLDTLFSKNHVLEIYDFVDKDSSVFFDGGHGTNVLSCMAGYVPGSLIAPAFRADYVLFRTEDDFSESKAEEVYWLIAAEHADSLGVDVINTSLGYSTFDNAADNYSTSDMDGNTTIITRAADLAASKGMVVVNSAGNSGGTSWNIITAPADGDSVLAVGATTRTGEIIGFSSRGPAADGTVKPDVMAVGWQTALCFPDTTIGTSQGTSFSSPLTAAMATGFWQSRPYLTAFEVLESIRKSGDQYFTPDNDYGYGMANFVRAYHTAEINFPVRSLQAINPIKSVSLIPSSKGKLKFSFANNLVGKELRISIINLQLKQTIHQNSFVLTSENHDEEIASNEILPGVILRIENVTEAKTEAIFRF
jgi:hypothetical protein